MTDYQTCHSYCGDLTYEMTMARELLEKHGKPNPQTVKKLRHETDMPMAECARMLRCMWRDMELEHLQKENVRLLHIVGECTSQLRDKHGLGYIVMPMGTTQALCETVAEIVGKRYDMTDEGVKFDD